MRETSQLTLSWPTLVSPNAWRRRRGRCATVVAAVTSAAVVAAAAAATNTEHAVERSIELGTPAGVTGTKNIVSRHRSSVPSPFPRFRPLAPHRESRHVALTSKVGRRPQHKVQIRAGGKGALSRGTGKKDDFKYCE